MIKEKKEYLLFRHRHRKRHKHDADCLLVFGAFRSRSAIVSPPVPEERKTEKSSLVITNARWSVNWNEKDEALWVYCRWNCFICDLWLYKGRVFFVFLLWCILSFIVKCLWEAQLPQGSVRFELDWTEHPSQGNVENKQWADPRKKAAQLLASQRKYGPLWDWFLLIKDTDEQRKY